MTLPIAPPFAPMEAEAVSELPSGGWLYEPKWDGFRCLVFRDGDEVRLQSKSGQPLARYFPELVAAVRGVDAARFVLDGEIVVDTPHGPDFDALLQRIHPAESRVRRLSAQTPAKLWVFDLLYEGGRDWLREPLAARREALERFARERLREPLRLSPASRDRAAAEEWLAGREGCDGVMAKDLAEPYHAGDRAAMRKIKRQKTADCVVGGFRYSADGRGLGSLLLGLYDAAGLLDHVGFSAALPREKKADLLARVEALRAGPGFTGRAPGGPSRWSRLKGEREWFPLRHELVIEVRYDHVTNGRFRHGAQLLRLRPDKAPRLCTLEQLRSGGRVSATAPRPERAPARRRARRSRRRSFARRG